MANLNSVQKYTNRRNNSEEGDGEKEVNHGERHRRSRTNEARVQEEFEVREGRVRQGRDHRKYRKKKNLPGNRRSCFAA